MNNSTRVAVFAVGLCLTLLCSGFALAQEPPLPVVVPTLTDTNKLQLQAAYANYVIASKDVELAQMKAQAAKTMLLQLAQTLQQPGFDLDVATMAYTAKPADGK